MNNQYPEAYKKLESIKQKLEEQNGISPEYHAFKKIERFEERLESGDQKLADQVNKISNIEHEIMAILRNRSILFADEKQLGPHR